MRRPQSRLGTLLVGRRAEGFGSPRWVREGQGTPDGVKCLTNKAPRLARIEKTGYNSSQKCFCYVFVCICLKNCLAGPFGAPSGHKRQGPFASPLWGEGIASRCLPPRAATRRSVYFAEGLGQALDVRFAVSWRQHQARLIMYYWI